MKKKIMLSQHINGLKVKSFITSVKGNDHKILGGLPTYRDCSLSICSQGVCGTEGAGCIISGGGNTDNCTGAAATCNPLPTLHPQETCLPTGCTI